MQSLFDFISSVRLAGTIEEEKMLISNETARIRAALRDSSKSSYDVAIMLAKLIFVTMTGASTMWAQMDAIQLMSAEQFSHKLIGYMCLSLILDESNDLSVLVTQTLLRDLASSDCNVQCLALSFIANLGSKVA